MKCTLFFHADTFSTCEKLFVSEGKVVQHAWYDQYQSIENIMDKRVLWKVCNRQNVWGTKIELWNFDFCISNEKMFDIKVL